MAQLGYRNFDDMVGQVQHLEMNSDVLHYKSQVRCVYVVCMEVCVCVLCMGGWRGVSTLEMNADCAALKEPRAFFGGVQCMDGWRGVCKLTSWPSSHPSPSKKTGRGPQAAAHPGLGAEREGGRDQADAAGPPAGAGARQRAHQAGGWACRTDGRTDGLGAPRARVCVSVRLSGCLMLTSPPPPPRTNLNVPPSLPPPHHQ